MQVSQLLLLQIPGEPGEYLQVPPHQLPQNFLSGFRRVLAAEIGVLHRVQAVDGVQAGLGVRRVLMSRRRLQEHGGITRIHGVGEGETQIVFFATFEIQT